MLNLRNGRTRILASMSDICHRMWRSWMRRSKKTSRASSQKSIPARSSRPLKRPAFMKWSCVCPMATVPHSDLKASRFQPGSGSVSVLRGRSTAIPSSWSWTSPIRTSMARRNGAHTDDQNGPRQGRHRDRHRSPAECTRGRRHGCRYPEWKDGGVRTKDDILKPSVADTGSKPAAATQVGSRIMARMSE